MECPVCSSNKGFNKIEIYIDYDRFEQETYGENYTEHYYRSESAKIYAYKSDGKFLGKDLDIYSYSCLNCGYIMNFTKHIKVDNQNKWGLFE